MVYAIVRGRRFLYVVRLSRASACCTACSKTMAETACETSCPPPKKAKNNLSLKKKGDPKGKERFQIVDLADGSKVLSSQLCVGVIYT